MNILDKIIEAKKLEITHQKELVDIEVLKDIPDFYRDSNSLCASLLKEGSSGIIAEFKQRSPSKGDINLSARVEKVTEAYRKAGAAGLSVLTEKHFFGGSQSNLVIAREHNPDIPILRKDFMIDPYQMVEAKAYGADVILLIAACLSKNQALELAQAAKELGLEVLMEIHNAEELDIVNDFVDIVGVNNRNLKTFEVSVETSVELGKLIPEKFIKISESGLAGPDEIKYLRSHGFKGFLIGETFMKTENPGKACKKFIQKLK
ncbi:indole-3-glycerol phosphate synthase TrpC [Maribellus sediminis]|uniref:indole-3-glycerol phosphate synthase TrpC n=1 Tax=Maribellus sediminis TaxID=2696285 RepID=UPI001431BBBC|nr:indole-3-glycerol phosphate synthase TrpC [Maribellus sediminis]